MSTDGLVLYEYPFSERIRTLLRLEDLFDKLLYFCGQQHSYCHHTALLTLFEILEVTSRADLKSDLLQELERHRQTLQGLRNNPQVSEAALASVLAEIEQAQQALNVTTGKAGQHLRDNEWLMSIRSRAIIPGGTCEFDLPSYHAWLSRDVDSRTHDLQSWVQPMMQFHSALGIVLKLLRETAHRSRQVAAQGSFQQMLQGLHAVDPVHDPGPGPEATFGRARRSVRTRPLRVLTPRGHRQVPRLRRDRALVGPEPLSSILFGALQAD